MRIAVVEGDGIGREVVPAALQVLDVLGLGFEKVPLEIGYAKWEKIGEAMTDEDIDIMKDCDCVFFGAVTTPRDPNYRSVLVRIRKELDLYANIRPYKSWEKINTPFKKPFDFIIVRENTEGMYSGIEEIREDAAYTTRVITRKGSLRIAEHACKLVKDRKNLLTIVHKANILKSCRFFRDICIDVARARDVEYDEMYIDAMVYNIILHPERFDGIVTTNLFGDILSDLAAVLVGGLGMCPSANIGEKYALFEPVHGSALDIAGKGIANPIAAILSAKMMLEWYGEKQKAEAIQQAVEKTLASGITTPDLGGKHSTQEVAKAVAEYATSMG